MLQHKLVIDAAMQVEEDRISPFMDKLGIVARSCSTSVRHIAETVHQPRSMVHKSLQKVLCYPPYKLSLLQKLVPADLNSRQTLALQFLSQCELQNEWTWNILSTNEAYFHVDGAVNTHN